MSLFSSHHARFLAWFMVRSGTGYDGHVRERKAELLSTLDGRLLEIGSGTGANLRFLPPGLTVVGLEPNPFMHPHFRREALDTGRKATIVQGEAEALPFPDESVDAVLSTLVLCSVSEIGRSLEEVFRVLRPGGRFIFMEHVAAAEGTRLRTFQNWIRPAWRFVGGGCEPNRMLESQIRRIGFRTVDLERFSVPLPVVSPHIAGVAVK